MLRLTSLAPQLTPSHKALLQQMWTECTDDILHCTTLAGSGHPGGSMSSLNFLLMTYAMVNITPQNVHDKNRDHVVVSHGHISPGTYSVLAQYGFFKREDMVLHFRKTGSQFGGHVETCAPGVEWNTGNLGQGLSAGCGFALAQRLAKSPHRTIVCMGDGEQQKGQIAEAMRFATKFKLSNLLAIIDYNRLQIGGASCDIMPQDIPALYRAAGWNVVSVDNGHDFDELFLALKHFWNGDVDNPHAPTVIIAHTVMGNGVSFMANVCDFHGRACTPDELDKALKELNIPNRLAELKAKRQKLSYKSLPKTHEAVPSVQVNTGTPVTYGPEVFTDNRSAYGKALEDLGALNNTAAGTNRIVGISCDLEGSVKMSGFRKKSPDYFFECGIQEHHSAVVSGSLSKQNFQVFFSTFGVFGVDEVYNQQRLNAYNETNVKTVCTHLGLSVGEDGPTHQSIDYIGLLHNVFDYHIFIPADPNQTDRIVRHAASVYGNVFIGMGRAKTPVITNAQGQPFFAGSYTFVPGKADLLCNGSDVTLISYGPLLAHAMEAEKLLRTKHNISARVLNTASIVPFDHKAIIAAAKETKALITMEDHHTETGVGSIVANILAENRLAPAFKKLGVTHFSCSGNPEELYSDYGMSPEGIVSTALQLLNRR